MLLQFISLWLQWKWQLHACLFYFLFIFKSATVIWCNYIIKVTILSVQLFKPFSGKKKLSVCVDESIFLLIPLMDSNNNVITQLVQIWRSGIASCEPVSKCIVKIWRVWFWEIFILKFVLNSDMYRNNMDINAASTITPIFWKHCPVEGDIHNLGCQIREVLLYWLCISYK